MNEIIKLCLAGALLIISFIPQNGIAKLLICGIGILLAGLPVIIHAVKNILKGKALDECFLMTAAAIGAFILGDYAEGLAVMLFYQVGEFFQEKAVESSKKSISKLLDINSDFANAYLGDSVIRVKSADVRVGDIILVKPGEKIPLDGEITEGEALIDSSLLTGESALKKAFAGTQVQSGTINTNGVIKVRVTKEFEDSTASKIIRMVQEASERKSRSENFISKFARIYTPIVVGLAVILAVLPPLITKAPFAVWVERALMFLVVSCPCALVISVPLSFFGGIGGASKSGILIKGSNYMEALGNAATVIFDKTGTLTAGKFELTGIHPAGEMSEKELLETAALCDYYSDHPIAVSLKKSYEESYGRLDDFFVSNVESISGKGIKALVKGKETYLGNDKLMKDMGIEAASAADKTVVHAAVDGKYSGCLILEDILKPGAEEAITKIKKSGVKSTVMLTGDNSSIAEKTAAALKIDKVFGQLLPQDKLKITEDIIQEKTGPVIFVGDGINDAPALARADVGIAMGALGADAAIEAADVVLMDDNPKSIAKAIGISRKTLHIVRENIIFSLAVKLIILILAAAGAANMWLAVFADVGVSIIAVLNALRALKVNERA